MLGNGKRYIYIEKTKTYLYFLFLYVVIASISITYTSYRVGHATIWPADALMLASIFSRKIDNIQSATLITFLASLIAQTICGYHGFYMVLYALVSSIQIFLSCHAYRIYIRKGLIFSDYKSILVFNISSGVIFPFICAILGGTFNALEAGSPFLGDFVDWFFSLSLGNVTFARPFTYIFSGALRDNIRNAFSTEKGIFVSCLSILITVVSSYLVFNQSAYPFLFIPTSLVIANSLLCGEVLGSSTVMLVSMLAIHFTFRNSGPIVLMHIGYLGQEAILQIYLLFLVFTERAVSIIFMRNESLMQGVAAREQMLNVMMSNATDSLVSIGCDGLCRWAGGASLDLLGCSASDVVGENIIHVLGADEVNEAVLRSFFEDDSKTIYTFSYRSAYRKILVLNVSFRKFWTGGVVSGAIVTVHDITKESEKLADAIQRSEKDQLTRLLNRAGFNEKMKTLIGSNIKTFCLSYIDIDHFKAINDTYGHEVGDLVLTKISKLMLTEMREVDIVSRFGGDEFVIAVLSDEEKAGEVFERLAQRVSDETFEISPAQNIKITISCGFARYAQGKMLDLLIQEADTALYDAKRTGRNRVCAFNNQKMVLQPLEA
ncbi:MAG: diguanylate cyclase [Acetobacter papayae]|uniref:diguanylate cyclase n=1 Tax=Acetobacter papayae TaxID=1076592 RepID=UPI0039EB1C23